MVTEKVGKRRLEWLGHVARIPDHRLLNLTLFCWLPPSRFRCAPRKRWKDVRCSAQRTLKLKRVNGMKKQGSLEQDGGHCMVHAGLESCRKLRL